MTTVFRRPSTAASPRHGEGVVRHGFASFFRAPVVEDMETWRADVGFVGVPFDAATNDRPGARRVPVFVGGDHAITFPIVRAFDDVAEPSRLTIIQFDAHQDYTDEKHGVRY